HINRGAPRRFPLLLRGGQFDHLQRIGMIDDRNLDKFVLRLEAGHPELYKLNIDPKEKKNLATADPEKIKRITHQLARSPIFPRQDAYFLHANQLAEMPLASTLHSSPNFDLVENLDKPSEQTASQHHELSADSAARILTSS